MLPDEKQKKSKLTSLELEAELFLLVSKVAGRGAQESHSDAADDPGQGPGAGFCRAEGKDVRR